MKRCFINYNIEILDSVWIFFNFLVLDFSFYCLYIHFLICHLSKACMDFQHNRIQYWILSFLLHVYVHVIMMWRPINAWESEEKTSFFVMSKVVIICESVSIKIHRNHLQSLKPSQGTAPYNSTSEKKFAWEIL